MIDQWSAMFRPDVILEPTGAGALSGFTFAVKETFDVAEIVTAAGNPDWLRTHEPAVRTAAAIEKLCAAGARMEGKTHTDELMYSLNGENAHYGAPRNPRAPGRIPGGSSSGSAVAVAAGLTDFALGTDTGGSIRIPASYCGVYGIRPSHGRVNDAGVLKLAPSFCTVGWMARSASLLADVGDVLLGDDDRPHGTFVRCLVPADVLELVDAPVRERVLEQISRLFDLFDEVKYVRLAEEGLATWMWAFRVLQGSEIWKEHGEWIEEVRPSFGPGIAERFAWTKTVKREWTVYAQHIRERVDENLHRLLGEDSILLFPTAPGPAPPVGLDGAALDLWRSRALSLTCIAGMARLPQVTVPRLEQDGLPVGLSLAARCGADVRLLHFVERCVATVLDCAGQEE